MDFGQKLKDARKYKGLTQQQLADKLSVTPSLIGQYETGKRRPKKENVEKIARALDLGYSYTKDGEPYFYTFVDTVEHNTDNTEFNAGQYYNAINGQNELTANYKAVNDEGKKKIVDYSDDIASNPKYKKEPDD